MHFVSHLCTYFLQSFRSLPPSTLLIFLSLSCSTFVLHLVLIPPSFMRQLRTLDRSGFGTHAPIMVPDQSVSMCQICFKEFTRTFRRHHCRACGRVSSASIANHCHHYCCSCAFACGTLECTVPVI